MSFNPYFLNTLPGSAWHRREHPAVRDRNAQDVIKPSSTSIARASME